jgi:hypothetical protein
MAAAVTVAVGAIGLIVGWFVSGYQRVTEQLTAERRTAYLELLDAAENANDDPEPNRDKLKHAAEHAEFVCSKQMLEHQRIEKLVAAVDSGTWMHERQLFIAPARYESQVNSYWGRRIRWRTYAGTVKPR